VETAERAFPQWSATAPGERASLLQRASELLMERQAAIAALVTEETNGTLGWGMFNVQLGAGMLAYYANQTDVTAEEHEIPSHIPGKRAKAVRQPVGVVVGIAPWNAPVVLGVRAVAAPLAYGNTIVLKASEQCPRTHAAIVNALKDAGLAEGTINLVTNESKDAAEVVEELIAHPAVRRISFTGSTRVGRIVAGIAARHLKRVLLELGGKAPLVVLADADLDRAVAAASFGSFMHQGQICMSTERIVIDGAGAGDPQPGNSRGDAVRHPRWERFVLEFEDGGHLILLDRRRHERPQLLLLVLSHIEEAGPDRHQQEGTEQHEHDPAEEALPRPARAAHRSQRAVRRWSSE